MRLTAIHPLLVSCLVAVLSACGGGSYGGGTANGDSTGGSGGTDGGGGGSGGSSYTNAEEFFSARIAQNLEYCRTCHIRNGVADTHEGRRFQLSSNSAEDYAKLNAAWIALGKGVETNRILVKPSDPAETHRGGKPWPADSDRYRNMKVLLQCWDNPDGCAALLGSLPGGDNGGASPDAPKYYDDVQKIVFSHCQSCHTAGSISVPLDTYPFARDHAASMAAYTQSRLMPPWPPDPGCETPATFRHARLLSAGEIDIINRWYLGGAQEGDIANAPPPNPPPAPSQPAEPPDGITLDTGTDFTFGGPDDPQDLYECFRLKPSSGRDIIRAELAPGNKSIVHHIILYREPGGNSRPAGDMGTCPGIPLGGEFLVGWAPGAQPLQFDPGIGLRLAPADAIAMQVHYHNTGVPQTDRSSARLWYSPRPVQNVATVVWGASTVYIPPGEHSSPQGQCTIMGNPTLIITAPHMHTRGTKFKALLKRYGEADRCLIDIPHWDFEWQGGYMLTTPLPLQSGDRITTQCTWYNETDSTIYLGEGTEDEMCFNFMYMTGWNGSAQCFF